MLKSYSVLSFLFSQLLKPKFQFHWSLCSRME